MIGQYGEFLSQTSASNRFRGVVYNKISSDFYNIDQQKFLAENVPTSLQINEGVIVPVDLDKWMTAVEKNPDRLKFVPT